MSKNIEWVHCNECLRLTKHEILMVKEVEETEEVNDTTEPLSFGYCVKHTLLECCGCGAISLVRNIDGGPYDNETISYPPRISRPKPKWWIWLPVKLIPLFNEVYRALHSDSRCLALMGARALIDLFMNHTIGNGGTFKERLARLVKEGYLSYKDAQILEPALDAGHAAVHRAYEPTEDDIDTVFDIVEHLLYKSVLEHKAQKLKEHTPKR